MDITKYILKYSYDKIIGTLDYFTKLESSILDKILGRNNKSEKANVWLFSTGRTGTALIEKLLSKSYEVHSLHEPTPAMFDFSFDYYNKKYDLFQASVILNYLRAESIKKINYRGQIYFESNNRLSFLGEVIQNCYPNSKYIFSIRNPYDYIISGLRRNWYESNSLDKYRIIPLEDDLYFSSWNNMSLEEKIAWNWNKTNQIVIDFIDRLDKSKYLIIKSEDLFNIDIKLAYKLFDFVGVKDLPSKYIIKKTLKTKVNQQPYNLEKSLDPKLIDKINQIVYPVASKFDYIK